MLLGGLIASPSEDAGALVVAPKGILLLRLLSEACVGLAGVTTEEAAAACGAALLERLASEKRLISIAVLGGVVAEETASG